MNWPNSWQETVPCPSISFMVSSEKNISPTILQKCSNIESTSMTKRIQPCFCIYTGNYNCFPQLTCVCPPLPFLGIFNDRFDFFLISGSEKEKRSFFLNRPWNWSLLFRIVVTDHIKQTNFVRVFHIMHSNSKYIEHLHSKEGKVCVLFTLLNTLNLIELEINCQSSYDRGYYPVKCWSSRRLCTNVLAVRAKLRYSENNKVSIAEIITLWWR